ncbi:universal stress protein [Actinoplanes derwentensis]|uniref:Universal stress protein family protein n=1 Tax=Actinoplanes derwentensis TaxID=113562 RepID=A0A1H1PY98_9ACTN|nr:universal stress protein [Actinoplanes derwentensis]GID82294.1 universal stress protein [Actinoplanes derwentensis]SDS16168.1 Universal stress protein family protein [Actinoplanes derwentensis]
MHIVVGVGRIPSDSAAIRLAAREAVSRGRVLLVVHAFDGPADAGYGPARRVAARLVDQAVATAQRYTPGVRARGQLVDGPPGRVLLRLSRTAVLLVVGEPQAEVVTGAWCPVAVARTHRPPSGPVVAAVDGSPGSVPVLRFAAEAAGRRNGALHVLHVSEPGRAAEGGRVLAEVLARVPEVTGALRRVLTGSPAATLIGASHQAGLLVLGPRDTAPGGRLGTVAARVLRHSACPAVLVRAPTGSFLEAR